MKRMVGSQHHPVIARKSLFQVFQALHLDANDFLFPKGLSTKRTGQQKPPRSHARGPLAFRCSVRLDVQGERTIRRIDVWSD